MSKLVKVTKFCEINRIFHLISYILQNLRTLFPLVIFFKSSILMSPERQKWFLFSFHLLEREQKEGENKVLN